MFWFFTKTVVLGAITILFLFSFKYAPTKKMMIFNYIMITH